MAIKFINEMADNERYKDILVKNNKDDNEPSKVRIKKFNLSDKATIENCSIITSKDGSGMRFLSGDVKLAKLKAGIVSVDGKPCDDEMIENIPNYPAVYLLEQIDSFNDEQLISETVKN